MVDPEKVKEKLEQKEEDKPQKKTTTKSSSPPSRQVKEEDTEGDELEQFKKSKGIDTKDHKSASQKTKVEGKSSKEEIEKTLRAIGNILLYVEGKMRAMEDPDTKREEVGKKLMETFYDQYTGIISEHNVQTIAERYGMDWEEDVIKDIVSNQGEEYENMVYQ